VTAGSASGPTDGGTSDAETRTFDGLASRIDAAGIRHLGFTSALLGEGVSTIALGTALSLAAARDDPVLLVDANWLQPSLTLDARLGSAPGLADYLARKADLRHVIRPASAARPAFLPVGDRAAARPTLRTLSQLLSDQVAAYKTVVVDLPPILAGEAFVLPWAALLDQLFVVLREAATPVSVLRRALSKVEPATARIVLNRGSEQVAEVDARLGARS
jgi:Mrp family chromosome partitioning ATPase